MSRGAAAVTRRYRQIHRCDSGRGTATAPGRAGPGLADRPSDAAASGHADGRTVADADIRAVPRPTGDRRYRWHGAADSALVLEDRLEPGQVLLVRFAHRGGHHRCGHLAKSAGLT